MNVVPLGPVVARTGPFSAVVTPPEVVSDPSSTSPGRSQVAALICDTLRSSSDTGIA